MNDKWLDDIQKRMSTYHTSEPEGLWEALEAQLPSQKHHAWAWMGGIAAGLAFAVLAAVLVVTRNTRSHFNSSFTAPLLTDVPNSVSAGESNTRISEVELSNMPETGFSGKLKERSDEYRNVFAEDKLDSTKEPQSELAENLQSELGEESPSDFAEDSRPSLEEYLAQTIGIEPESRDKRLAFNAFAAGATGAGHSVRNVSAGPVNSVGLENASWKDSPLLGVMLLNQGRESQTKTRHSLPVRFGFGLSYNFNDKLQASTGLSYSVLNSSSFEGTDNNYIEGKQSLHYIGMPISLNYICYTSGNLDLYASGGALVEKCVGGKTVQKFVLEGKAHQEKVDEIDVRPWQFSLNLSAGVQYRLSRHASVYLEPGLAYYFKDGTRLNTVYKEKPLNFDLRLGFRLQL